MSPSLTIVLPIHNGESRLRGCVGEILELASELTPKFNVLIVDDGSTDDTYAAAEELSCLYPQISVRRNRHRRGLDSTLESIRPRIHSDVVIVHDGVSAIDPNQVRMLWRQHVAQKNAGTSHFNLAANSDARVLVDVVQSHAALAQAHGRLLGFQLVTEPPQEIELASELVTPAAAPRTDAAHRNAQAGVGRIPTLPRPKFLAAIKAFAFGE